MVFGVDMDQNNFKSVNDIQNINNQLKTPITNDTYMTPIHRLIHYNFNNLLLTHLFILVNISLLLSTVKRF